MPIYEYKCRDCGTRFEALRSMKDSDATIGCQNCMSTHTLRVVSTCYSKSDGLASHSSSSGCASCSGGSCRSCGH